jgi:site-specific DNA-methyltransferase (adenine-specific)
MTPKLEYRVGDVFDRLAEIPDNSIDLIVSSPPFLALRSYLPDDHPDKGKEIGQEPTPAAFIDTHLALAAEYARVLAPHGSLCYEIGDTYAGGDGGAGWPLAKSMCIIPHLFTGSLAYGRNLLTGQPSPAGEWRIRNVICWARPNPPVGALGDKFRPATSYITVACKGKSRYFDLDAVRTEAKDFGPRYTTDERTPPGQSHRATKITDADGLRVASNPAGAPPLDWHADNHPEDGDWLWKLSTQPYKGSHFATFPMALPKKMIESMCPLKVCTVCGTPSTRIVESEIVGDYADNPQWMEHRERSQGGGLAGPGGNTRRQATTLGWTDCGHNAWRTGVVLDPFGGSGTTAEAAQAVGRSAILIDLDERNAHLAQQRVGMFLEITESDTA